jgi:bifunctional oligoribonuclease and PAP phosphatase NrnA
MDQVARAIRENKSFLITAHVNLEGDSLGSQLAMKELLDSLGKESFIYDADPVPEHLMFLPKAHQVKNKISDGDKFDVALVLDCPTLKRVGKVAGSIKDSLIVNIDHHISNENFGKVNWVDAKASSAGEMVYHLFGKLGQPLTKEAALDLYIAILTDTGSFNYDNTSKVTHEIAGELLGYGLDPAKVSENVYERKDVTDLKLLGMVLATIKVDKAGEIAYMELTKEMLESTGADISKSEGLVNYARSIDKVKVAMLFREDPKTPGRVHVSFRSKGDADVNEIAQSFGGGGHMKASGCVVDGTLAEAEKNVLAKVEENLARKR